MSFRIFSTHATIAAAVVNEPAGSAKNEMPNGGTSAFLAFASMSRASARVLAAEKHSGADAELRRPREYRVLDKARHFVQRHVVVGEDCVITGIERHVHVERAMCLVGVTI